VSQGTVRKALDEMTVEKVVVRRQGRGTFVAEHTQEQALFHFFRLTDAQGNTPIPASEVLGVSHIKPAPRVQELLNLKVEQLVTCIRRVRLLEGKPSIYEEVFISKDLFPDIEEQQPLPNTLYTLYQVLYGFSVLKARERVRAIRADSVYADKLGLSDGAPVLEVERLAFTIDGNPIELRYSFCNTESFAYQVELT
jgi:GntR family transcriptional regulator